MQQSRKSDRSGCILETKPFHLKGINIYNFLQAFLFIIHTF